MRFTVPAALTAALVIGAATLSPASVSNAAAPVPVPGQALLLTGAAIGVESVPQTPRLEAAAFPVDQGLSMGTNFPDPSGTVISPEAPAASLAALVERHDDNVGSLNAEMDCLASAVFYEARSESLAGKLAVARVIINRSESGRFPRSLCGVVTQPGQFSFVRGGRIPDVPATANAWSDSVAIARVAMADEWESQAEGALYFHASRVAPGWRHQRLARIDNHIFYR